MTKLLSWYFFFFKVNIINNQFQGPTIIIVDSKTKDIWLYYISGIVKNYLKLLVK